MTKVEEIKEEFLKETYQDTWRVYEESLKNNLIQNWDWIVLTASNKEQANTYKEEINYRLKRNLLPKDTKYLVLEDPEGKRVGSGGATLNVLKNIIEKSNSNDFLKSKILVIHSGGDSKRIPQYSSCGKLFSPVQRELPDGRSSTLFDEFVIAFSAVPSRMSPGMIVLSGDVLLVFNPLQIDLQYVDSAAISIKSPVETGCNHGVFFTDEKNMVKKFLHKQSIENLKNIGAVNENNLVDIDTGAIYFSTKILNKLKELISTDDKIDNLKFNLFVNENSRVSFYGDFLYPLATDSTYENYLKEAAEGTINEKLLQCREIIWNKLNKYSMKVIKLSPADFIHFGTTKELMELLTTKINKYKCLGWEKNVLSNANDDIKYIVNHSYIDKSAKIEEDVYLENSCIGTNAIVGKNVILSNVSIENCIIPDNVCMNTIQTKDNKYVTRIYGIGENPKVEKSSSTTFLNTLIENMMKKYDIKENDIWNSNDKSIWKANLFCLEEDNSKSINSALILHKIINCNASIDEAKRYFGKKRTSLCDSFNNSDTAKTRNKNQEVEIQLRNYQFINQIIKKQNVDISKSILLKSPNLKEQVENLLEIANKYDYTIKSRIFLTISKIMQETNLNDFSSKEFEDRCYEEIKKVINISKDFDINKTKILDSAYVELPIRVNFGGGWSDTPPYCNENGGIVLNAAFKLNGENPIKVKIEKNFNNVIKLKSIDLNIEKEIYDINEIKDCVNTNDAFSLLKASLLVSGIIRKEDTKLEEVINRIGSGISITTDVTLIPKGSGLGTSSILAGACLKAIYKFLNVKISDKELSYKVLEQEQLMGTGGGWQDQIGGIVPGIKCISTQPSMNQKFEIEKIHVSESLAKQINDRFMLIYTGQRRLAKNLLRDIMNSYISYNANTLRVINKIKNKAIEMAETLRNENIEEFSKLLNEHWELSKDLDKGCTNTCINQILKSCDDLISGKMICGAGGGGFLQVILKEGISKEQLKERIKEVFQDSGIKVFEITLFEGEEE